MSAMTEVMMETKIEPTNFGWKKADLEIFGVSFASAVRVRAL